MLARFLLLLALSGAISCAAAPESGQEIFDRHCRTCHGGPRPADVPLGPNLAGVIGTKAGSRPSGLHTRVLAESGLVWDRDSLRRFITDPRSVTLGTIMPAHPLEREELERLLDYLETLR